MAQKILIVDDEPDIVTFMKDALSDEGYEVFVARDGRAVFEQLDIDPDLIILDVMMPELDGFEVCRAIRERVDCPILFLSARQAEADRIRGLLVGGDDYLIKPIGVQELNARVNAHLRREHRQRRQGRDKARMVFFNGDLTLNIASYELHVRDKRVPFTPKQFEIVQLLLTHPNQVFSREHIYERVWGLDAQGDATTVTEHMKKIRAKLARVEPNRTFITTVWGVGYKWEPA